jgi:hypothetical protein
MEKYLYECVQSVVIVLTEVASSTSESSTLTVGLGNEYSRIGWYVDLSKTFLTFMIGLSKGI